MLFILLQIVHYNVCLWLLLHPSILHQLQEHSIAHLPMPAIATSSFHPSTHPVQVFSSSGNSDAWFLQLRAKYWTLCALVVAHVMLTGYIDPLKTSENLTQLILYL